MTGLDYKPEELAFPDEHFEKLYEADPDTPEYNLVQGNLYQNLRNDARSTNSEYTLETSRALNRGNVEKAEELVEKVLEE